MESTRRKTRKRRKKDRAELNAAYNAFRETELTRNFAEILVSDYASIPGAAQYVESLVERAGVKTYGTKSFRNQFMAVERDLSVAFLHASRQVRRPATVDRAAWGCRGWLYRGSTHGACNNIACPTCFTRLLRDVHEVIRLEWDSECVVVTTTLVNHFRVDKVEQEIHQASTKDMSNIASATSRYSRVHCKVHHIIDQVSGTDDHRMLSAAFSIIAVVHRSRLPQYLAAVNLHKRYDIGESHVFDSCDGAYLGSCFRYPMRVLLPGQEEFLEQIMKHTPHKRIQISRYLDRSKELTNGENNNFPLVRGENGRGEQREAANSGGAT